MAQGPRHLQESFVATGLRHTEQTLSDAQKAQARTNIGAGVTSLVPASGLTDISGGGLEAGSDQVVLVSLNAQLSDHATAINQILVVLRAQGIIEPAP